MADETWEVREVRGDFRKFSEYVLVAERSLGKSHIFINILGYRPENEDDAQELLKLYVEQASIKFANGEFTVGKKDRFGQRFTISIEIKGEKLETGWILQDEVLKLATPFTGFAK